MLTVAAAGDSFVWGSELADCRHSGLGGYSRSTFPALLSKGHNYTCVAYPGATNKEILDQVLQTTANIVIVSWTWPTRDNKIDSDTEILTAQEYLNTNGIPYLFTCADNCVVTNNTLIDYSKWFMFPVIPNTGWHPNEDPRGFYQWALEHKYQLAAKDRHPLEQAHIDAAELMKDQFNEVVKKHLDQDSFRNPVSKET
jgi:hypothetical protein